MTLYGILLQALPTFAPDSLNTKAHDLEMLKTLSFDELVNKIVNSMVTFAVNLTIAIIVFTIGKFFITKIHNIVAAILLKRKIDPSICTFVLSLVRILLYFILIVTVIGILGIETSSFLALFASAGVAIGMALSGTLQNFAGGVLILLLKPYRIGDYIEASGYAGTVKEIQIFNTVITTPDNKSIIIPNGGLSTGSVNNYSRETYRRVDWTVSISYGDDVDAARKAILEIIYADERIIKECPPDEPECIEPPEEHPLPEKDDDNPSLVDRIFHRKKIKSKIEAWDIKVEERVNNMLSKTNLEPKVYVSALADSSVNLSVRAWTKNENYWAVYFATNEKIYKELPKHGIHFPFPQMDVHVSNT